VLSINSFNFRFEAHLEVHAGSIDEEEDEQGIAHMIEHVAFLGSKKREKLLGTGARSNAYTDFHHTVFHIHAPTSTKVWAIWWAVRCDVFNYLFFSLIYFIKDFGRLFNFVMLLITNLIMHMRIG